MKEMLVMEVSNSKYNAFYSRPPSPPRFFVRSLKTRNASRTHMASDRMPCLLSVIILNFVPRLRKAPILRTN